MLIYVYVLLLKRVVFGLIKPLINCVTAEYQYYTIILVEILRWTIYTCNLLIRLCT